MNLVAMIDALIPWGVNEEGEEEERRGEEQERKRVVREVAQDPRGCPDYRRKSIINQKYSVTALHREG